MRSFRSASSVPIWLMRSMSMRAIFACGRARGPFRLVVCDPPYPGQGAALYGTGDVDTSRAFRAMATAVAPGAHVVWFSTHRPLYQKRQWHRWGSIVVEPSTGKAWREVSCYTRRAA